MCEGLNYIHSQDIIHRDLKPGTIHTRHRLKDNILVQELEDGEFDVKIIDFGLSFQKRDTIMITQQNCGTLIYSAPEVATNHQYNQVAQYASAIRKWIFGVWASSSTSCSTRCIPFGRTWITGHPSRRSFNILMQMSSLNPPR